MDEPTAWAFHLHLVFLMVFAEELEDAINAHPKPTPPAPLRINETHPWLVMSVRLCCYSKTIQPVAAAHLKI